MEMFFRRDGINVEKITNLHAMRKASWMIQPQGV